MHPSVQYPKNAGITAQSSAPNLPLLRIHNRAHTSVDVIVNAMTAVMTQYQTLVSGT